MSEALAIADVFLPDRCSSLELPAARTLVTDGGASWNMKWDFACQCKSDKWLDHKRHSPSKNNQLGSIDEPKEKSHLR